MEVYTIGIQFQNMKKDGSYDDHYRVGLFTFPLEEILEQDQKKMDLFLKKKCLPTYYG